MEDLTSLLACQTGKQFLFPYSHSMKAYLFGNFEEQLAFNSLTDEEVIDVLNDVNTGLGHATKASFSDVDLNDGAKDLQHRPRKDDGFTGTSSVVDVSQQPQYSEATSILE